MAGLRPGAWTRHRPRLALAHARLAGVTTDVAIEPMWAIGMYASRLHLGDVPQVIAVVVLAHRPGEAGGLGGGGGDRQRVGVGMCECVGGDMRGQRISKKK